MFSKIWNKLLPVTAVGVASCALLKTAETGNAFGAAINAIFLLYAIAITMSRMK